MSWIKQAVSWADILSLAPPKVKQGCKPFLTLSTSETGTGAKSERYRENMAYGIP
jgi:hypothetical protein